MKHDIAAILLVAASAACAGSAAPGSPAPAALAYAMPADNPVTYTATDTVSINMDVQGTPVDITVSSAATLEASFTPADNGISAEIRYTALSGSFANSMGPAVNVGNGDLPGAARLHVGPRGEISVVDLPEASEGFRQVLGAESAYRRLFMRLPGRTAAAGTMWTDTVSLSENIGGMTTDNSRVITSTLTGDTTVNGRMLQVIRSESTGNMRVSGMNQGVEVRQYLNQTTTAITLWDPVRRLIVERIETTAGQGSMELPAMGMTGMPVRSRGRSVLRLQGG